MLGKHISNIIPIGEEEEIISAIPVDDFNSDKNIVISSKLGMIKKTNLSEFKVSRYTKPISCMKLKENDEVVNAFIDLYSDCLVATNENYSLWFSLDEVPTSGIKSSGVKSISLKHDEVVSVNNFDDTFEYITIFSDKNTAKRIKVSDLEKQVRARRGYLIIRDVKSNPHKVKKVFVCDNKSVFGLKKLQSIDYIKQTELPILDRIKTGTTISKEQIIDVFKQVLLVKKEETKEEKQEKEEESKDKVIKKPVQVSLLEIDDKLKMIDEFLEK